MSPRVSAYLPVYNQAAALEKAIRSVQCQTLPLAELLVVDDASTDGSANVAVQAGARVLRLPSNQGRGAARAMAMIECSSEFVLCCDATCALDADFAARALPHFESADVAAVFGVYGAGTERTAAERWRSRHLFKVGAYTSLDDRASLATYGALLRREAVLKVGNFDARLRHSEDAELDLRLRASGHRVLRDPACRVTSLVSNGIWKTLERYARWNSPMSEIPGWRRYLSLIAYSLKVMVPKDLQNRDLTVALISVACPHFQAAYSLITRTPGTRNLLRDSN
jgi:glycosyltransferase involved in cell wall biosynthesis